MTFFKRSAAALPLTGLLMAIAPAQASGPDAWAAFNREVTRACVAASGIRNPLPSTIVGFDDRVGKVVMLVMNRARGGSLSKLCVYDKRTRRAFIDDAEMWSAPPQR